MGECERIIASIEHFYGHMEIECCDSLGLCSVEYKEDLELQERLLMVVVKLERYMTRR